LRTQLEQVKPDPKRKSTWSNYIEELPYTKEQFQEKESTVKAFIEKTSPKKVLDIGCNDGFFSFLAAKNKASVVSIDSDPVVIGKTWREAKKQKLSVLPLVVDISRPSPAVGWLNNESSSFFDRFIGKFDMVFMLAIIHHLVARERTPLKEVIQMASELTTKHLIIEFVGTQDGSVAKLARGRDSIELDSPEFFESCLYPYFDIIEKKPITDSHRILYLLLKRHS
jgi:SAM-dependent methyltransferase